MLRDSHKGGQPPEFGKLRDYLPATCVTAAVLAKLAKHLALLASLTILGEATGRIAVSELAVFILVVVAALSRAIGCTLQLRLRKQTALNKGVP
jgi:lysylphosphatidylglycerol synthetase-like protein (DUF2156 family)